MTKKMKQILITLLLAIGFITTPLISEARPFGQWPKGCTKAEYSGYSYQDENGCTVTKEKWSYYSNNSQGYHYLTCDTRLSVICNGIKIIDEVLVQMDATPDANNMISGFTNITVTNDPSGSGEAYVNGPNNINWEINAVNQQTTEINQ